MRVILNRLKFSMYLLGVLLIAGCGCTAGPESRTLNGFEVIKDKRNFLSNIQLELNFRFLSKKSKGKSPKCLTYNKELAIGEDSDIVLRDSLKVFCDKKLYFREEIKANTNLLNFDIAQTFYVPESINPNLIGRYLLNLQNVEMDSLIKYNPYNFKIQVQTNNKILTDTINIIFK